MSEFKFACPVCGQHITVPSSSSGAQMACPTCFREIVVPQAPAGNDSKLLLEAAQPTQPRPTSAVADLSPLRPSRSRASLVANIVLVLLLCVAAGVLFSYRATVLQLVGLGARPVVQVPDAPTNTAPVLASWTLDPAKAVIPEQPVSGRLHGTDFECEKVLFGGGTLSLRKGQGWPPDLGLDILLSARRAEQLNGKNIIIAPGVRSVVSKVVLRWKDDSNRPQQTEITSGYALTLLFGKPTAQRLPGRLNISLPDSDKSYLAGTFEAEIFQPQATRK